MLLLVERTHLTFPDMAGDTGGMLSEWANAYAYVGRALDSCGLGLGHDGVGVGAHGAPRQGAGDLVAALATLAAALEVPVPIPLGLGIGLGAVPLYAVAAAVLVLHTAMIAWGTRRCCLAPPKAAVHVAVDPLAKDTADSRKHHVHQHSEAREPPAGTPNAERSARGAAADATVMARHRAHAAAAVLRRRDRLKADSSLLGALLDGIGEALAHAPRDRHGVALDAGAVDTACDVDGLTPSDYSTLRMLQVRAASQRVTFTDFAPRAFRSLRSAFGVSEGDFRASLCKDADRLVQRDGQ